MYSQYGELRLTNGRDPLADFGHASKFQRVSRLGYVTAATSLNGGQPNFARCLTVSWATLSIHFRGLLSLAAFYHVQHSLCVQVLCSPILAALLAFYCTALEQCASAKLRRSAEGATYTRQGGHHVWQRHTF